MELLGRFGLGTDVPALVAMLAFFGLLLLYVAMRQYSLNRGRRRAMIRRIQGTAPDGSLPGATTTPAQAAGPRRRPFLDFLGRVGRRVAAEKTSDYGSSRYVFLQAGLHGEHVQAAFWGVKALLAMGLPLVFIGLRMLVFKLLNPIMTLYVGLLLAFLGFYLPNIWLRQRIARRKVAIFKGLPDGIDLLLICVEAGMGLNAAINHVAQKLQLAHPALSAEFNLFALEMRTGKDRKDALRSLALRTGMEDMDTFATMLIQTEKFGTSVGRTLRVFSDTFRTKRFQKAEEIAAKLPVMLTFPCILFIFPALFVAIAGPAAIRVYETLMHR